MSVPLATEELLDLTSYLKLADTQSDTARALLRPTIVLRMIDEIERSRALLARIEWREMSLNDATARCPECGSREENGHEPHCDLCALLQQRERHEC